MRVALDGSDLARRRVLERAHVTGRDAPAAHDGQRLVVERPDEWRHEIARGFQAGVEQDHDRRLGPADPDIRGGGVTEPFRGPDDLDGECLVALVHPENAASLRV